MLLDACLDLLLCKIFPKWWLNSVNNLWELGLRPVTLLIRMLHSMRYNIRTFTWWERAYILLTILSTTFLVSNCVVYTLYLFVPISPQINKWLSQVFIAWRLQFKSQQWVFISSLVLVLFKVSAVTTLYSHFWTCIWEAFQPRCRFRPCYWAEDFPFITI